MQSAMAAAQSCFISREPARAAPPRLRAMDLERYRRSLTSYARHALRNAADAEDAVQDTLLAALNAPDHFGGRSSLQTWLHGILKHKIIDIFRRRAHESVYEMAIDDELPDESDTLFTADGQWRVAPASWGNPEALLERRELIRTLEGCIACLPENTARAFTMREVMGLEVSEICEVLRISPDNCYVMLHRARMKLRSLLEQRWFATTPSPTPA
jgi:RNA polymerase sigma-70 factor (ECF subfamily)